MQRPSWIRIGLWGIRSRALALGFMWLSIVIATLGVAYGFRDARFFACAAFYFSALMYWLSIRWVDTHDTWEK